MAVMFPENIYGSLGGNSEEKSSYWVVDRWDEPGSDEITDELDPEDFPETPQEELSYPLVRDTAHVAIDGCAEVLGQEAHSE